MFNPCALAAFLPQQLIGLHAVTVALDLDSHHAVAEAENVDKTSGICSKRCAPSLFRFDGRKVNTMPMAKVRVVDDAALQILAFHRHHFH